MKAQCPDFSWLWRIFFPLPIPDLYKIKHFKVKQWLHSPHLARFVTRFPVIIALLTVVAGTLIPVDAFFTIMILPIWAGATRDTFRGAFHVEIFADFWAAWCTFTVYHSCWTRYCCEQHCEKEKKIFNWTSMNTCFSLLAIFPSSTPSKEFLDSILVTKC